jgi:hypothetical protein
MLLQVFCFFVRTFLPQVVLGKPGSPERIHRLNNKIIEWTDSPPPRYDRILRIDSTIAVVVIDVTNIDDDDVAKPVRLSYEAIVEAFRTATARIVDQDPYLEKLRVKIEEL